MTRIVCIGEAMVELAIDAAEPARAAIGIAGDTFNTAIYLKRSLDERGVDAEVSYATCMGEDDFSARFLALLAREGLSPNLVGLVPDRVPGLYAITTDAAGERSFSYWREASAARRLFTAAQRPTLAELLDADWLYLSAITLAILEPDARQRLLDFVADWRDGTGRRFVFDSNYRPRLWASPETARLAIESAWRLTDVALPSIDDERALFGDSDEAAVLARLRDWGVRCGALKRAAAGPVCFEGAHVGRAFPPAPRVVDSTAAGDSFNAGYVAALVAGASPADALEAGHALATLVVQHRGAIVAGSATGAGR